MTQEELIEEINRLRKERNAVLLAHNYQIPVIQDIADFTGDSLGLARQAAKTDADLIVFCGVTSWRRQPPSLPGQKGAPSRTSKRVVRWRTPSPRISLGSGRSSIPARSSSLRQHLRGGQGGERHLLHLQQRGRGGQSIPEDKEILFLPDMFLGSYVEKMTGRKMHIWMGECHVHAGIHPDEVQELAEKHPEAELLVHPECGCSTSAMYEVAAGGLPSNTALLSTGKMIKHVAQSPAETFIVATEVGILHRLQQENPAKRFVPASEHAVCPFMKMITLEKVYRSLRDDIHVIEVDPDTAAQGAARDRADDRDRLRELSTDERLEDVDRPLERRKLLEVKPDDSRIAAETT